MKKTIGLVLLVLSVSAAPVLARRGAPQAPTIAPPFTLPGRSGTVSYPGLAGKVVYVDFWASWCGPCRQSFPWLKTLHERYAAKGLAIVAINLDKERDAAQEFLEDFPAPFLVAFDPSGKTADAFHVATMPSSYVVGADGTILHSIAGFDPGETDAVEQKIREELSR
jgi:thiol-disulfide isomerase/thioredoxin